MLAKFGGRSDNSCQSETRWFHFRKQPSRLVLAPNDAHFDLTGRTRLVRHLHVLARPG
jgi:hypothetical protein